MTAISDLCVWRVVLENPESTTLEALLESLNRQKDHLLLPCLQCDGYDYFCKNYRFVWQGTLYKL